MARRPVVAPLGKTQDPRRTDQHNTANYLLGMPLLGDYLEGGLSLLRRDCKEYEIGRVYPRAPFVFIGIADSSDPNEPGTILFGASKRKHGESTTFRGPR